MALAYAVLTVDIAIVSSALQLLNLSSGRFELSSFLAALPFAAIAALTGFLLHEMAHKVTAQRLGFWSEFRASPFGLLISVLTAVAGFLFAAPGATLIGGQGTVRDWGRSALAGPLVNFLEGSVFLGVGLGVAAVGGPLYVATPLVSLGFFNGWFAAFNLLPFGPLDGRKVLSWNPLLWGVMFGAAATLTGVAFFL